MSPDNRTDQIAHLFLSDTDAVRNALARVSTEKVVGLDTETYWDATAASNTRVSLIQIANSAGEVLVIDALTVDLEAVRPLIEDVSVLMAAHNARFDEMVLTGAGMRPEGFVDTLRMARSALHLASYSLTSVTGHLFNSPLDKTLQRSNWRRRPLTREQIEYAALDALMTLRVYEELSRLLAEQGRLEEVLNYATLRPSADRGAEPKTRRRRRAPQVPSAPLSADEKRVVAYMKGWRLALANARRVPAYMICPDKTLEHLARARPADLEALQSIHGLGDSKIERYGEELLTALREACEQPSGTNSPQDA